MRYLYIMAIMLAASLGGIVEANEKVAAISDVTLKGELGARYQAAMCNLLTRQDRYSLATFESSAAGTPGAFWWDWPGDQLGRWLSILHVAEGNGWTPAAAQRKAIGDIILPHQSPDGNFGPKVDITQKDARVISGNCFALRGLMDAYADTRDPRYLEAARKLGHYFEATFPTWEGKDGHPVHEFYAHCVDGLVKLYELGGDKWALDMAKKIGDQAGRTAHTHHSLSLYRGMIDLYRVTKDPKYLAKTEDYLLWCRENRIVTGGLPEAMPSSDEDEGCGLADYVIVNLMAYTVTGKGLYLDEAENTLVNHMAMNQFHTGGFGHRAYAQDIVGGKDWQGWDGQFGSENVGCCSLWGACSLGQIGQYIVTQDGDAVDVNLYPCADVEIPDRHLRLSIRSDYPRMRTASISIHIDKEREFPVRLRVPKWAEKVRVSVATKPVEGVQKQGRLVVDRKWKSGDKIEVVFESGIHLVPWPEKSPEQMAVFDGPLCLGLYDSDGDLATFDGVKLIDGKPVAVDESAASPRVLHPIGDDWQNPDVKNPHRIRVLFKPR